MQLISKEPLTTDEFKQLHEFLSLPHDKAEPMTLTEIHGFLTALLSAPNLIMPSKWQPILFGGHPNFDSMEQASSIIGLIGRFNNQISDMLRKNDRFEPLIFNHASITPYHDTSFPEIAEWCKGYLKGTKLDDDWYFYDQAIVRLFPFGVFAGEIDIKGEKDTDGNTIEDDTPHKERMKQKLPDYIIDLFKGCQEHRKFPMSPHGLKIRDGNDIYEFDPDRLFPEPIRNPNKTGRNEQCPCGSGKKYKKCCIASNQSVH
jgi:uncharacterized protein